MQEKNKTDEEEVADPSAQKELQSRIGAYVEALVADLARLLTRSITTTGLLLFTPNRARYELEQFRQARMRYLLRPHTYLLLGCLLFSAFVSAMYRSRGDSEVRFSHRDTTELLVAELQGILTNGASVVALVIKTLPILMVATLAAVLAGWVLRNSNKHAQEHFLFVFGLQGIVVFIIGLTAESLGSAFQVVLGSDDYLLVAFLLFAIVMFVQSFRLFWAESTADEGGWAKRLLTSVLYLALYCAPLPLASLSIAQMEHSLEAIQPENRRLPGLPPVVVVEFETVFPEPDVIELTVLALLKNKTEQTIAVRVEDVRVDVYFVTPNELDKSSFYSSRMPSNARPNIDSYNSFSISVLGFRSIEAEKNTRVALIEPGAERALTLRSRAKVDRVQFVPSARLFRGRRDSPNDRRRQAEELRTLTTEAISNLPEKGKLNFVANGNWVFIKLSVPDRLSRQTFQSLYSRGEHRVRATRAHQSD